MENPISHKLELERGGVFVHLHEHRHDRHQSSFGGRTDRLPRTVCGHHARAMGYRTAKCLLLDFVDHFRPGGRIIQTPGASSFVAVQAFETREGKRKVLVVNQRNRWFPIQVAGAAGGTPEMTDQETGEQPARRTELGTDTFTVDGYRGAVVSLPGASQR